MSNLEEAEIKPERGFNRVHAWRLWIGDSGNSTTLHIWYNGTQNYYRYENLPTKKAFYLVYVLRNVKSLFIDPNTGVLEVSAEPVGPI